MPFPQRWVPLRSANPTGGKWNWKGELLRFLRKAFKIRIWADPSLWLLKKNLVRERRNYILLEGWKNSPEYIPNTLNWAQKIPKTVINLYLTRVAVCVQNPLFFFPVHFPAFPPPQTQKRSCLEMCIPIFSFWEYYQVDMNKLQRIYHLSKMHF